MLAFTTLIQTSCRTGDLVGDLMVASLLRDVAGHVQPHLHSSTTSTCASFCWAGLIQHVYHVRSPKFRNISSRPDVSTNRNVVFEKFFIASLMDVDNYPLICTNVPFRRFILHLLCTGNQDGVEQQHFLPYASITRGYRADRAMHTTQLK